jgi:hypothetical protein
MPETVLPSDSAGVENVSMRPGKLHSNVAASLPSTQGDLFKTGNEKGMGGRSGGSRWANGGRHQANSCLRKG